MIFTYKGIDAKGNHISSDIEATTLEEAKEKAVKMVYAVLAKCANDIEMFRAN